MSVRVRCPSCDEIVETDWREEHYEAEMTGLAKNGFKKSKKLKSHSTKMKTPVLFRWETNDDWLAIKDLEEMMKEDFYTDTLKKMSEPLQGDTWKYLHIDVYNGQYLLGISNGERSGYEAPYGPHPIGDLTHLLHWMKRYREEMLHVQNEFSKSIQ